MSMTKDKKFNKIKRAVRRYSRIIKKKAIAFRIETISRLGRKTLFRIGAGALCLVLAGGVTALALTSGNGSIGTALSGEEAVIQPYWAIQLDGKELVALKTEKEAKAVLDGLVSRYTTEGMTLLEVTYKEDVSVEKVSEAIGKSEIMNAGDAIQFISTGRKEPKTYTVLDGDHLSGIANLQDMPLNELMAINPGVTEENMAIGSTLNVYERRPFFTICIKEQIKTVKDVEYSIVYEETATLYKGENKVKTAGVMGKSEITKEQYKENGVIVSAEETATKVLEEPQAQVVLQGSLNLPSAGSYSASNTIKGTGNYFSPMGRLEVSSAYNASRGGGRHQGVDLRNPQGTPIMAVDDGTVVFAGNSGSYGNLVRISHGGGLETYYAHCDTISVSIGQTVEKGQLIATVGKSGRASGYHLHFEVRINGEVQNPMNYL